MTTTFIWKDGREETYDWDVTWGSSGYGFFKCTRFERSHFLDTPFIPDAAVRTLGESENLLRMSGVYVESDWQAADALRHHQVTQSTEHPMPQFELGRRRAGSYPDCLGPSTQQPVREAPWLTSTHASIPSSPTSSARRSRGVASRPKSSRSVRYAAAIAGCPVGGCGPEWSRKLP